MRGPVLVQIVSSSYCFTDLLMLNRCLISYVVVVVIAYDKGSRFRTKKKVMDDVKL